MILDSGIKETLEARIPKLHEQIKKNGLAIVKARERLKYFPLYSFNLVVLQDLTLEFNPTIVSWLRNMGALRMPLVSSKSIFGFSTTIMKSKTLGKG